MLIAGRVAVLIMIFFFLYECLNLGNGKGVPKCIRHKKHLHIKHRVLSHSVVRRVHSGSKAKEAGLLVSDFVVKISGYNVHGVPYERVVDLMKVSNLSEEQEESERGD